MSQKGNPPTRPESLLLIGAAGFAVLGVALLVCTLWFPQVASWAVWRIAMIVSVGGSFFAAIQLRARIKTLSHQVQVSQDSLADHQTKDQARIDALGAASAAEAERNSLLQRLTLAMNAAGISMWEWDIKTDRMDIMEGSAFTERLGGRTDYLGRDYPNLLVHPDDLPGWVPFFTAALTRPPGEDLFTHRYRAVFLDGSNHWIQFHGRIKRNRAGIPVSVLAVDWDVTKEVLAAEEIAAQARKIAETEARLLRAVGGTQDALFDLNIDSTKSWLAPRFYALLGYDESELQITPESWASLVHPDDQPRRAQALQANVENNRPVDVEYRLRKKSQEWIWVRSRGMASAERDSQGRPIHFSGALQDITEERIAREKLIAATHAAEEASRAKSAFLATMSHEIRTPMNGILGMTTLLLDSQLDNVQRDFAQTVRSSADSLLRILNDILDFSKIEAGKLEIESIDMDLVATIDDIGTLMAFQCAAKNLELIVNIHPDVPAWVIGDPQRLRQCLLNLLGNAIKFTQSGEVFIDVFTLGRKNGQTLVRFEVRDTGLGIERSMLRNLFQPFTQADSSTTRRFGGTGLGLSIVSRLVELMGGNVGVESEPGKGSLFWFTLSFVPTENRQPLAGASVQSTSHRVLVVDDNETNRRVLAGQLVHAGYEVQSAGSGAQALAIMRENLHLPFDLVLLDFEMPEMDGAVLGEVIMDDFALRRTRLIMLTSLDRSGDLRRFADIGFAAYLTKPIRNRELLRCLRKALGYEVDVWQGRSQPMITQSALMSSDKGLYEGKVLIVEDNVINQRVAARFLERLGCEVEIVDDGAKAVDSFNRQTYALILMDMQMPVMDGLEATRRIRAIEVRTQAARTPIVALTANAQASQMDSCLEAGMDDYLTKPLDIDLLHGTLDRFMKSTATPGRGIEQTSKQSQTISGKTAITPSSRAEPATADALTLARLKEIAGADDEFATELINAFLASGREIVTELRVANAASDLSSLGRAAHKLKGASNNLHIGRLGELAHDIELCAKAGANRDWQRAIDDTAFEFERVCQLLTGTIAPSLSPPAPRTTMVIKAASRVQ